MTPNTARLLRMAVSALTTGLMGAGTLLLGSMTGDGQVKPGAWLIATVSGIMFLCKDLQASLSTPPHLTGSGKE
jgi:hypothetical protein